MKECCIHLMNVPILPQIELTCIVYINTNYKHEEENQYPCDECTYFPALETPLSYTSKGKEYGICYQNIT